MAGVDGTMKWGCEGLVDGVAVRVVFPGYIGATVVS